MKYNEFLFQLKKKNIANIYLFYGAEDYFKQEALKKLQQILLPQNKDFNYDLIYAKEIKAQEIINIASTLPLMSEKRMVVVKEIEKLGEKEKEKLIAYLKTPAPHTCLVFIGGEKVDFRNNFYKMIQEKGEVVIFYSLLTNEILAWIKDRVKEYGKEINLEATSTLAAYLGQDLFSLDREIEKLVNFCGRRKQLTLEDIEAAIYQWRKKDIFNFIEALTERNKQKTLEILKIILEEGEEPTVILHWINRRLRQLLLARHLLKEGGIPKEVAKHLGINLFFERNFFNNLQKISIKYLREGFAKINQADVDIKSGKNPPLVLELLVLSL